MFHTSMTLDERVNINPKLVSTFLSALLVVSVVLNVLLAREVASLRETLGQANDRGLLMLGETVPEIDARSLDGSRHTVIFSDVTVPTVLYVFSPECSWCKKNLSNLHALIEHASNESRGGYRVLGIALNNEGLAKYLEDEHLTFPVYSDVSEPVRNAYHMGMTPTTIVVSPDRKVLRVWTGAYHEQTLREIDAYFHITMPGMVSSGL